MNIFSRREKIVTPQYIKEIKAKILTKKLIDDGNYRDYIICETLIKKEDENLLNIGEIIYIKKEIMEENEPISEPETKNNDDFFKKLQLMEENKTPEKKEEFNFEEITERIKREIESKYKKRGRGRPKGTKKIIKPKEIKEEINEKQ